jgi:hypothetical protein
MKALLEAIHGILFGSNALKTIVGTKIEYAKAPTSTKWPLLIYFDVVPQVGYQIDYNALTVQFSFWSTNKWEALELREIITNTFNRLRGTFTTAEGDVEINWSELIDSGPLAETDTQLYGFMCRYFFRYRGQNIGGV